MSNHEVWCVGSHASGCCVAELGPAHSQAKTLFVLYDGRAKYGMDTEDCSVLGTAQSATEAWADSRNMWRNVDAIWFEYDIRGKTLVNERVRLDIGKGVLLP